MYIIFMSFRFYDRFYGRFCNCEKVDSSLQRLDSIHLSAESIIEYKGYESKLPYITTIRLND